MLFTSVWLKVAISHQSHGAPGLASGRTSPLSKSTRMSPTTTTALDRGGSSFVVTLPIDRRLYCHQVAPRVSFGWTVSRSMDPSGARNPPTLKDRRHVVGRAMHTSIARACKFCGSGHKGTVTGSLRSPATVLHLFRARPPPVEILSAVPISSEYPNEKTKRRPRQGGAFSAWLEFPYSRSMICTRWSLAQSSTLAEGRLRTSSANMHVGPTWLEPITSNRNT